MKSKQKSNMETPGLVSFAFLVCFSSPLFIQECLTEHPVLYPGEALTGCVKAFLRLVNLHVFGFARSASCLLL